MRFAGDDHTPHGPIRMRQDAAQALGFGEQQVRPLVRAKRRGKADV